MLANILDAAEEPPTAAERETPDRAVNRRAIAEAHNELTALIARQRDDEAPITAQAIAQANLMAVDPRGPLYGTAPPSELMAALDLTRSKCDALS